MPLYEEIFNLLQNIRLPLVIYQLQMITFVSQIFGPDIHSRQPQRQRLPSAILLTLSEQTSQLSGILSVELLF